VAVVSVTPIVALDVPDLRSALRMVREIGAACDFYKVGSELFTAAGPDAVAAIRGQGKRVFLDLKFHDIPNTVRAACASARTAGAALVTVHAWGGPRMLAAAVEGAGDECGVLAVTVLTSFDSDEFALTLGLAEASIPDEVSRLAGLARDAGAHGVVCSGHEAPRLRAEHGAGLALLVPGIRLPGGATHDQSRFMTPRAAADAGATYIVLGRAVTAAVEPSLAMSEVLRELNPAQS
jgi:orotidine-5'-phosphate decarboxylase